MNPVVGGGAAEKGGGEENETEDFSAVLPFGLRSL